jgi:hypothetical protein
MARTIPYKEDDFHLWQSLFIKKIKKRLAEFHIDGVWFTDVVLKAQSDYEEAYVANQDRILRNVLTASRKNAAKEVCRGLLSLLVGHLKMEPGIKSEDLVDLRVAFGTPSGRATQAPDIVSGFHVDTSMPDHLLVYVYNETVLMRGRPEGAVGFLIRWGVTDTLPANVEDLPNTTYGSQSPVKLPFNRSMSGKTVVLAVCWVNVKHDRGLWSVFVKVVIP